MHRQQSLDQLNITDSGIDIQCAATQTDIDACLRLRHEVFTIEQGIDPALDDDGLDSQAFHYLVFKDNQPIGTARAIAHDQEVKIGRVAVLKPFRGLGVGAKLMRFIMAHQADLDMTSAILGSQLTAVPFYERLGFIPEGNEFLEAGIPHIMMRAHLIQKGQAI